MARIYALGCSPSFKNGSLARLAKLEKSKVFFFVLQFSSFESLEIERNSVFPSIQALIRETDTHFEEPRMHSG